MIGRLTRRGLALIAGLTLLALVLGFSSVSSTVANWTDADETQGGFTAGQVPSVQNLSCINQGLGGLLTNKVKLEWTPPQNPPGAITEYEITVTKSTATTGPVTTTYTTTSPSFMYTDANLVAISSYVLTVRQKTTVGGWTDPGQSKTASGISVLLGLTMVCGSG